MRVEVFVDYDGTITDADTFDVLVRRFAGDEAWLRIEARLDRHEISLRGALALEASYVRLTFEEAEAHLEREIGFDPTFAPFVARCRRSGIDVTVVSSGVEPLIVRRLARHGLQIPVIANAVDARLGGWQITFRDPVDNGTDKARVVRDAKARGSFAVFAGDGRSDLDAALEADRRFVKRGKLLERVLLERGVPYDPFDDFGEVAAAIVRAA